MKCLKWLILLAGFSAGFSCAGDPESEKASTALFVSGGYYYSPTNPDQPINVSGVYSCHGQTWYLVDRIFQGFAWTGSGFAWSTRFDSLGAQQNVASQNIAALVCYTPGSAVDHQAIPMTLLAPGSVLYNPSSADRCTLFSHAANQPWLAAWPMHVPPAGLQYAPADQSHPYGKWVVNLVSSAGPPPQTAAGICDNLVVTMGAS